MQLKLAEIGTKLKELPEPPKGNLSLKVFEKILQFDGEMQKNIDGGAQEYPFQKEWHLVAMHFRRTLAYSYPRLALAASSASLSTPTSSRMPYRPSCTPTPRQNSLSVINVDSDEDKGFACSTPTHRPKRKQTGSKSTLTSPPKRSRLSDIPLHISQEHSDDVEEVPIDRRAPFAKRFSLTDIRNIIRDAHIGLPNQVHPKATERMIKESLSLWDKPLQDLLRITGDLCHNLIAQRLDAIFGIWTQTRLFESVHEICRSWLTDLLATQKHIAERSLCVERHKALTYNYEAMQSASEKALPALESACREDRAKSLLNKLDPNWAVDLTEQLRRERIAKVVEKQLGTDPYIQEIRAMAVGTLL